MDGHRSRLIEVLMVSVTIVVAGASLAACGAHAPERDASAPLEVVAAENFWGSIAAQLGGEHVEVQSLIANPDTDPHDYEPTPRNARALAAADLVITNGIGYDPWVDKLLAANPKPARSVIRVGDLVELKEGANPHQWYSPAAVDKVSVAVTDRYEKLAPPHARSFRRLQADFEGTALRDYRSVIADIRSRYAGTPIGASENIVTPMAAALGLEVKTPDRFLHAISEGDDPTAADKATVDRQLTTKAIKVFVVNSQNATPDVQRLVDAAKANGVALVTVTETLTPRGATFQDWQTSQLRSLEAALAGTGNDRGAGR